MNQRTGIGPPTYAVTAKAKLDTPPEAEYAAQLRQRNAADLRPGLRLRDSLGHPAWQHEQYIGEGQREL